MATAAAVIDDLLAPISEERPAGEDITQAPEWPAINQARRRDKLVDRQNADWPVIKQLVTEALARKSKDLRLAVFLTEANIKLDGFTGLAESARLLRGLLTTFWDSGLYPELENGDPYERSRPLEWLRGDNLPRTIRLIPLTARTDGGRDCSYIDYRQSRSVGWERDTRNANGDPDEGKVAKRNAALAAGGVSAEMFEDAVKNTRRAAVEAIVADAERAREEFLALDRTFDEKFGAEAPATSEAKDAIDDCQRFLADLLKRKRQEEPDPSEQSSQGANQAQTAGQFSFGAAFSSEDGDGAGSWREAEEMVRQGRVQDGIAQMTQLSARQYGRVHFQHRLRLAEVCLSISRERLAIAILEELAKIVDEYHLEKWESPELLGRVWGRLYKCYRTAGVDSEQASRADVLFDKLCRLDPWQALRWDE